MAIQETFTQTSGLYSANNREFTISSADSTGFDFLRTSDVKVYLTIGGTKTLKTETTDYTLDKATKKITFVLSHPVPPTDSVVTAQRVTAVSEPINTFQAGSAVTASALNDSLNQLRFNIQEYGTLTNSGSLSDTDKGHISVSDSGNTWEIDDGVVNSDKLDTNIDIRGSLDVTSNATFDSNVTIKGDDKTFAIQKADTTNKFTVASQTGNTTIEGTATIAGTLGVTGATTLTGALAANAGITVDTDKFTVADSTGNTVIDGTLNAKGEVTVDTGIIPDADEGAYLGTVAKPFSQVMVGEIKIASTDDNTIDTVEGNLELDSATGTTVIDDNCNVTGTLGVTSKTTLGPLVLSTTSKDVTGLTTLALHDTDNTGNNITNAASFNLSSSSGTPSIASITGGVNGQIIIIRGSGSNNITLTNTSVGGTEDGFVMGKTLDVSEGDVYMFIHAASKWFNISVGDN